MRAHALLLLAISLPLGCQRQAGPPPEGGGPERRGPFEEARQLIEQGQPDTALARLEQAPPEPEALYLQGLAWAKKAETAPLPTPPPPSEPGGAPGAAPEFKPEELRALELFERVTAAKPDHAPAHVGLGDLLAPRALERLERQRQAAAAAAAAAARHRSRRGRGPEPTPTPVAAGPEASVERVIAAYRQAVQADPASTVALERLILFASRADRLDEADAGFQELLRRDRENPEQLVRYGDFLSQTRKDTQGAIAQYAQALIWRPDDDATKSKIADIYVQMASEHMARDEWASADARLKDARKYVTDKDSPQWLRIQDLTSQLAQIRRPAGK